MNDYFYGGSFGRLSLLDEVNIWRGRGVPGIWRYQLSGICCFTPKTPTQIFAFTLVGSTHRHSPALPYSPRQFAFLRFPVYLLQELVAPTPRNLVTTRSSPPESGWRHHIWQAHAHLPRCVPKMSRGHTSSISLRRPVPTTKPHPRYRGRSNGFLSWLVGMYSPSIPAHSLVQTLSEIDTNHLQSRGRNSRAPHRTARCPPYTITIRVLPPPRLYYLLLHFRGASSAHHQPSTPHPRDSATTRCYPPHRRLPRIIQRRRSTSSRSRSQQRLKVLDIRGCEAWSGGVGCARRVVAWD